MFFSVLGRPKRAGLAAARIPRGPGLFHGAATGLFSGCPSRRFGHTFTADFAFGGRAVNVNRIMVPSTSTTTEYQHALTGTNALGPQVNHPSFLKAHTTIKTTTSIS